MTENDRASAFSGAAISEQNSPEHHKRQDLRATPQRRRRRSFLSGMVALAGLVPVVARAAGPAEGARDPAISPDRPDSGATSEHQRTYYRLARF